MPVRTEIELAEYDRVTVPIAAPTADDLELAARLNEENRRKLELRWLAGGRLEVISTSCVGVVNLDTARIRIRPKFAGYELGVLKMLAYTQGNGLLRRLRGQRSFSAGSDLVDLICLLLAEAAQDLIRDGLLRDYVTEEDSLKVLRGSLKIREQATRRFGQLDTLECRFDDFHADIAENQLLRSGLRAGARASAHHEVAARLRRLDANLGDLVSAPVLDADGFRKRVHYTRRNEHYRGAHNLCLLLLDHLGVDDLYSSGEARSFAFLLNMNVVFESFVAAVVAEAFEDSPWRVESQRQVRSVIRNRETGRHYASLIPDILLSTRTDAVPFDAKYKLYGRKRKVSTSDIYQSFVYAYALAGDGGTRAGIVYPASDALHSGPLLTLSELEGSADAHLTGIAIDLLGLIDAMDDDEQWAAALAAVRQQIESVLQPMAH